MPRKKGRSSKDIAGEQLRRASDRWGTLAEQVEKQIAGLENGQSGADVASLVDLLSRGRGLVQLEKDKLSQIAQWVIEGGDNETVCRYFIFLHDLGELDVFKSHLKLIIERLGRKHPLELADINLIIRVCQSSEQRAFLRKIGFLARFKNDASFEFLRSHIYKDVCQRELQVLLEFKDIYLYPNIAELQRDFHKFQQFVSKGTVKALLEKLDIHPDSDPELCAWLAVGTCEPVPSVADVAFSSAEELVARSWLQEVAKADEKETAFVETVLRRVRVGTSKYSADVNRITIVKTHGGLSNDKLICEAILSHKGESLNEKEWIGQGVLIGKSNTRYTSNQINHIKGNSYRAIVEVDASEKNNLETVKYAIRVAGKPRTLVAKYPPWLGEQGTDRLKVINGPVCSGKTTLVRNLLNETDGRILVVAKSQRTLDSLNIPQEPSLTVVDALAATKDLAQTMGYEPEEIDGFQTAHVFYKNIIEPKWIQYSQDPENTEYPFGSTENPLEHFKALIRPINQLELHDISTRYPEAAFLFNRVVATTIDKLPGNLVFDHLVLMDASLVSPYELCSLLSDDLRSLTVVGNSLLNTNQSALSLFNPTQTLTTQYAIPQELSQFAVESPQIYTNQGFMCNSFFVDLLGSETKAGTQFQNLEEAEFCAFLYIYMILQGFQREDIVIVTAYAAQKLLIEEIIRSKSAEHSIEPCSVLVATEPNGGKYKYVVVSLVQTTSPGIWNDPSTVLSTTQLATSGLYVLGLFERYQDTFYSQLPSGALGLVPSEKPAKSHKRAATSKASTIHAKTSQDLLQIINNLCIAK
ncbi:hypothetical protein OGAPHI_006074 [Ogataea philodendri]|uniref:DNA2/NAM7 helicase-like C-terminal domain-containing protein n=1 Tax=Ogataea philodendri TaxID=1378263 RepID=A0A9P8T1F6_9ASCO|nr:uncharacterized protein OGAPHI_006074 [Ogataea philodendri]KAH3661895.1 hypothetical protein OGAPHI_006074 [Ogataea philodendri]